MLIFLKEYGAMRSKCGLVRLVVMNIHIVLQALSLLQAHTGDLRIFVIVILEQGKLGIWRVYHL